MQSRSGSQILIVEGDWRDLQVVGEIDESGGDLVFIGVEDLIWPDYPEVVWGSHSVF